MTTNKKITFRSMNDQQCLTIYEPIRQNARRHFAAAELLAKNKDYPNGIGHLILGTEELVKSMMLLLQGLGFPVRDIKNYDQLFYKHNSRHNLLKECYSIYLFAHSVSTNRPVRNAQQSKNEYLTSLIMHGLASVQEGLENYVWWNDADKLKQNCFYLDYNDNGIANPATIDYQQWLTAHQFVGSFTLNLNNMMVKIANATPADLTQYKKDYDVAELNELFSASINRKRIT